LQENTQPTYGPKRSSTLTSLIFFTTGVIVLFLYLTVSFKFINFSFQVFLLFVPEISSCFTSYFVEITQLFWFGSCNRLYLRLFPLI